MYCTNCDRNSSIKILIEACFLEDKGRMKGSVMKHTVAIYKENPTICSSVSRFYFIFI
jgi:hypothetical protein